MRTWIVHWIELIKHDVGDEATNLIIAEITRVQMQILKTMMINLNKCFDSQVIQKLN